MELELELAMKMKMKMVMVMVMEPEEAERRRLRSLAQESEVSCPRAHKRRLMRTSKQVGRADHYSSGQLGPAPWSASAAARRRRLLEMHIYTRGSAGVRLRLVGARKNTC